MYTPTPAFPYHHSYILLQCRQCAGLFTYSVHACEQERKLPPRPPVPHCQPLLSLGATQTDETVSTRGPQRFQGDATTRSASRRQRQQRLFELTNVILIRVKAIIPSQHSDRHKPYSTPPPGVESYRRKPSDIGVLRNVATSFMKSRAACRTFHWIPRLRTSSRDTNKIRGTVFYVGLHTETLT